MATYVLLSTLTNEGRATLRDKPGRLREVNAEIERFGCHLIAQYGVLGPYDFVTVIEAPDNETASHLSFALGARGTVNIMTLPCVSISALETRLSEQAETS